MKEIAQHLRRWKINANCPALKYDDGDYWAFGIAFGCRVKWLVRMSTQIVLR